MSKTLSIPSPKNKYQRIGFREQLKINRELKAVKFDAVIGFGMSLFHLRTLLTHHYEQMVFFDHQFTPLHRITLFSILVFWLDKLSVWTNKLIFRSFKGFLGHGAPQKLTISENQKIMLLCVSAVDMVSICSQFLTSFLRLIVKCVSNQTYMRK